jgi:hypothetical protein
VSRLLFSGLPGISSTYYFKYITNFGGKAKVLKAFIRVSKEYLKPAVSFKLISDGKRDFGFGSHWPHAFIPMFSPFPFRPLTHAAFYDGTTFQKFHSILRTIGRKNSRKFPDRRL